MSAAATNNEVKIEAGKVSSRAVRIYRTGGVEVLTVENIDIPCVPKPNEMLVQVAYAGLNFYDTYFRSGLYPAPYLPYTLGREASGIVRAVGTDVKDYKVGSRVVMLCSGCYSEYVMVDPSDSKSQVSEVPSTVSLKTAAGLWLQGLTAHYLGVSTYPIKSSDTVLIHAAAGGTGGLLVQIAKLKGARVIATVSSEEKEKIAKSLGADEVINYKTVPDFHQAVLSLTGGKGVNCVYDGVGKDTWEKSLKSLKPLGMLVLFGNSSGPVPPIDTGLLSRGGSLFVTRTSLFDYCASAETLKPRGVDLWNWMNSGTISLRIAKVSPMAQIAEATTYLEGRSALGKVVVSVNESLDTPHISTNN